MYMIPDLSPYHIYAHIYGINMNGGRLHGTPSDLSPRPVVSTGEDPLISPKSNVGVLSIGPQAPPPPPPCDPDDCDGAQLNLKVPPGSSLPPVAVNFSEIPRRVFSLQTCDSAYRTSTPQCNGPMGNVRSEGCTRVHCRLELMLVPGDKCTQ